MNRTGVELPDVEGEGSELTIEEIRGDRPVECRCFVRVKGRYLVLVHAVLEADHHTLGGVGQLDVDAGEGGIPLCGNQLRIGHLHGVLRRRLRR